MGGGSELPRNSVGARIARPRDNIGFVEAKKVNCRARTLLGGADSPNVALEQWEQCGYTIHPVGRDDSARRMCQFITGRKCRCARRAHYDSLRAAAKRRLLACTLAAAREEGALRPLLRITPAGGCSRVPATANKFVHILWKNLICGNVAAAQFCARPRGRRCWRCEACAHRFHKGDAPAECCAGAQCAPLRVTDAVFSALGSWPRMARRGRRALRGAANPLPVAMAIGRQMEGATDSYARSASSRRGR